MTAPDKPGLSNEEFIKKWKEVIPTAEFVPERGVKLSIFMQALDRLEALIGQGQAERDFTPEQILLEKLQELKVELAFQHGSSLHECKACSLLREITGDDGTMEGISGKLISITSADKAEREKK